MTWPVGESKQLAAVEHRQRVAISKIKTDVVGSDSKILVFMLSDFEKK